MGTKLKSWRNNSILKIIAFTICVLSFVAVFYGVYFLAGNFATGDFSMVEMLDNTEYHESATLSNDLNHKAEDLVSFMQRYPSAEYVNSGKAIDQDQLDRELSNLSDSKTDVDGYSYDDTATRELFLQRYATEVANIKQHLLIDSQRDYARSLAEFNSIKGMRYYVFDGKNVLTNLQFDGDRQALIADFAATSAHVIYHDQKLVTVPGTYDEHTGHSANWLCNLLDEQYNPNLTVLVALDKEYLEPAAASFQDTRSAMLIWLPFIIISTLLLLISFIYSLAAAGKVDENGQIILAPIDRMFTEFQLLLGGIISVGGAALFSQMLWSFERSVTTDTITQSSEMFVGLLTGKVTVNDSWWLFWFLTVILAITVVSLTLISLLSLVRMLKAHRFWKNSMIYRFFAWIGGGVGTRVRNIVRGGSVMHIVAIAIVLLCLLSGINFFFAILVAIVAVLLATRLVKKYEDIKTGITAVKNGDLSYQIKVEGDGELDNLARDINQISGGFDLAVKAEVKNQRLKSELISNVSHDIKTPLTSIITYIDLLKREGLDCPDAPKYLDILEQKSARLRKLTEDLFDAAKASSGAVNVHMERVELLALIHQALGEMSGKIETCCLEFRVNAVNDHYYVRADGQLLWRVIENLLGNVFKYAKADTRVYIDLHEDEDHVWCSVKNISNNELNIPADELLERFKRGDESRSTEGSGLGLAIAQDLMNLQEGTFEVVIDGDLFKAVLELNKYRLPKSEAVPDDKNQKPEASV